MKCLNTHIVYNSYLRVQVTHTCCQAFSSGTVTTCLNDLGLLRLGFRLRTLLRRCVWLTYIMLYHIYSVVCNRDGNTQQSSTWALFWYITRSVLVRKKCVIIASINTYLRQSILCNCRTILVCHNVIYCIIKKRGNGSFIAFWFQSIYSLPILFKILTSCV